MADDFVTQGTTSADACRGEPGPRAGRRSCGPGPHTRTGAIDRTGPERRRREVRSAVGEEDRHAQDGRSLRQHTVYLPTALSKQLNVHCAVHEITKSAFVERLIRDALITEAE